MRLFDLFEDKLKTAIIGFGRMNPPTTGHGVLVDAINAKAKQYGGDPMLFLTMTHTPFLTDKTQKLRPWDKIKNPLQWKQKLEYAQKFFNIPISTDPSLNTIMSVMKHLETKGYEKVVLVCGSDRVKEFETQVLPYNNTPDQSGNIAFNIKEVSVEEGGFRDEEADDASGMSASKMREAAANNDFESFKQGVPVESLAKKMFNDVRQGLGMNHQSNEATLVKPMGAPITRNPVAKNSPSSGTGAHNNNKYRATRDPRKATKHKGKQFDMNSIAEGHLDMEVMGHKYMPDEDREDDNVKIWHTIVTPQGKTIDADFTPYAYMDKEDLKLFIKLDYPKRQGAGPLNKEDLQKMAQSVGVAKLDPDMANAGKKEAYNDDDFDWGNASKRDFKRKELELELGHEDEMMKRDQQGPWYIKIDGKIYKQKGEPKVFSVKKGANNYALAIIKNKPQLQGKILLTRKPVDDQ